MGMGNTPILLLKEGTRRDKGKDAQYNNIQAARAISDAVRSTLGPRGMDKMLVDSLGDVVITNDGVTILREIDVDHPAAKMLVEVARTQDEQAGDGTTTAVILSGELLKKAVDLIDSNIHPTIIAGGYRLAATKAQEVLDKVATPVDIKDTETLKKIAGTAMISKSVSSSRVGLSDLSVKAVTAISEQEGDKWIVDMDNIQIVKKTGGSMNDTQFIQGIIIDKEPVHPAMPHKIEDAKVALLDAAIEVQKTEIDAKIEICFTPAWNLRGSPEGLRQCKELGCRFVQPVVNYSGPDCYRLCRELGLRANAFYVDTDLDIRLLLAQGADGMLSNRPDIVRDSLLELGRY